IVTGEVLQTLAIPSEVNDRALASDGTTLYAHFGLNTPFRVIDASLRGAMSIVGEEFVDIGTAAPSLAVGGGTAFVIANGIWAVDVSDPTAPSTLRNADTFFPARGGSLNGSGLIAIASGSEGFRLFDVSNPLLAPVFITQFALPGLARKVQIASGIAFVA